MHMCFCACLLLFCPAQVPLLAFDLCVSAVSVCVDEASPLALECVRLREENQALRARAHEQAAGDTRTHSAAEAHTQHTDADTQTEAVAVFPAAVSMSVPLVEAVVKAEGKEEEEEVEGKEGEEEEEEGGVRVWVADPSTPLRTQKREEM